MSPSLQTMGFFMSDINFCNTKEQLNHLGEVVTGKVDGSPMGADIDTSTLPYTGQVRKTLPALEGEYEQSITDKESEADAVIDSYRLLNKGPYASGITLESKFEFITYNGESYFANNPPYTTTSTTPDTDGNLFLGGYTTFENVANKIGNKNELSNSNFLTQSPEDITHPNTTPESYVAGTQIFSGVYAGDSGCTITFIDGRVNCTAGDYKFKLPNTGGLERVPVFTSSVSDYDGIPKITGVSHALVGDEYVVTVTPTAGDVFGVKLEQGSVATRHDVDTEDRTVVKVRSVEDIPDNIYAIGSIVKSSFRYRDGDPVLGLKYLVLPPASADGFVDHNDKAGNLLRLIHEGKISVQQAGAKGDWFNYESGTINPSPTDDTLAIQAAYDYMTRGDNVTGFGWSVYYPTAYYAISSEIKSPSATRSFGDGRYNSHIIALPGFTGVMVGDKGSAAKLYFHDIEVDTRDEAGVTDAIRMGYTIPFGTEGGIYEVLLTGGDTNAIINTDGLNVVGNVGLFHHISAIRFKRGVNEGPGSAANHFDNMVVLGCKERSYALNTGSKLTNWHLEAPLVGSVPISIGRSSMIDQGTISLGNDSITNLIEMESGSISISVKGMYVLTSGAGTFTNVLSDLRPSSLNQHWANDANKNNLFNFDDKKSTPIGTSGEIKEGVGGNIEINSKSASGGALIGSKRSGATEYFISNASIGFDGPSIDNVRDLARAGQRYTNGFFVNTPTGTSDRNHKTDFQPVDERLKSAALEVKGNIQLWKWIHRVNIEGESARWHVGPIAQDIHDIFESHNLNPFDYAILGKDDVYNDKGEKIDELWSIKPIELIWLILSTM